MYSVLIQNQKTMESFEKFHPLFLTAINEEKICACRWLEPGMNIETAVPELYSHVNTKEEWRAIIVRVEDEPTMAAFETYPDNPYDFKENITDDTHMRESDIPLIRLTHMLGGMPSPNVEFESRVIVEENKTPRMVYVPTVREEDMREYKRLNEKYHLNAVPPSEIVLISLRKRQDQRVEHIAQAWTQHKELESSEFWKRNGYPSSCRFCVFETSDQGPAQETADMFRMWLCVLLLAINEIDASTLQAYKLHRLDVEFDRELLTENMEATAGKVISARDSISKSIERELAQKINEKTVVPDYALTAPVVVDLPTGADYLIKDEQFKLTSRTTTSDMENWEGLQNRARKAVNDSAILVERALDRTADRMRDYTSYSPSEVLPLDPYQLEDFNTSLATLRDKVLELRTNLPGKKSENDGKLDEAEKSIREKLIRRLTRRQAALTAVFCAMTAVAALVPGVVLLLSKQEGTWGGILLTVVLCVAGPAALLAALAYQRWKLKTDLSDFNGAVGGAIARIAANSSDYSDYMSGLASYAHGKSYLDEIGKKKFLKDEAQYYKRNHVAALNAFLVTLKEWTVALHLSAHVETADLQENFSFDTGVSPYVNPLYTFDDAGEWYADLNSTGDTVQSPFKFIRRLRIEREELYDDDR